METLKSLSVEHKKRGKEQAPHIVAEQIGTDHSKQRKNKQNVDRGNHTTSARFCSAHIREFYPSEILGDGGYSEFCVRGRHLEKCCFEGNKCSLCFYHLMDGVEETEAVNFAETIAVALNGNIDRDPQYCIRLNAFMMSIIGCEYPTKKKNTALRVMVNGMKWIEYYLKLVSHNSRLKAISPSGYKVKFSDRF